MTPSTAAAWRHLALPTLVRSTVLGTALGFVLSRVGFTDYRSLFAMFTLTGFELLGVFVTALLVVSVGARLLRTKPGMARAWQRPSPHSLVRAVGGGVAFGLGWVISGACPGVALVQLGEGKLWALIPIVGMVLGTGIANRFSSADDDSGCAL